MVLFKDLTNIPSALVKDMPQWGAMFKQEGWYGGGGRRDVVWCLKVVYERMLVADHLYVGSRVAGRPWVFVFVEYGASRIACTLCPR